MTKGSGRFKIILDVLKLQSRGKSHSMIYRKRVKHSCREMFYIKFFKGNNMKNNLNRSAKT